MNKQAMQVTCGGADEMSALMLVNMVPSFTGDATGPDIRDFLEILQQVGRLGGWQDGELIGIARCKMTGAAHDFAWWDDSVAAAADFSEFRSLALKRFDTEPFIIKMEKFLNARQNEGEEVRSFASRVRMLGSATLVDTSGENPMKAQVRREMLAEEVLSRFLTGLRDPIRRFVLSRDPKTFDEAIEVAVREELNEKLSQSRSFPVRYVGENADALEMRSRLDRLEKMLEESLKAREPVRKDGQGCATRPPNAGRCYNCGGFGHYWQECHRYQRRQWNPTGDRRMYEGRDSEETVPKSGSGKLGVASSGDRDGQVSISVVDVHEQRSAVKTERSSPAADEINVISQVEEPIISPLGKCVLVGKACVPVPSVETKSVEFGSLETDGLTAVPTLKVPRDVEALPVGVADLMLKEVQFPEDKVVGALVDMEVCQTMARVDKTEECQDYEGVVFVEPRGSCSTLDKHRTELTQRQQRPHKVASPALRSEAELGKWEFGPFNEDPKLRVGEKVHIKVDAERSGIG
ncbi:hypothetical protein HPB52_011111 [Rhipicephalus sanguineus]|uniref:CCHC-type domain-containing protein n=1 Tax=Rhipicephalus sanguineus TaxID=34632 RepID=A0A9D4YPF6_RHISA|nr:hypothetical protein HPB52_011111 [Rhipicephalus sanguineus]